MASKKGAYPYKDGWENSLFSKDQPHCPKGMEQNSS